MAVGKASAGRVLSIVLLICFWGSCSSATTVITAQTPDTFTVHCTGLADGNKGTVTIDYGEWILNAGGQSTLTFADTVNLEGVNCHFAYSIQGPPVHKIFDVFSITAPCAQSSCEWVVQPDGFYSEDASTGALTFVYQWDSGTDTSFQ